MQLTYLTAAIATLAVGVMAHPSPAALPNADIDTYSPIVARAEAGEESFVDSDGDGWPDYYRPGRRFYNRFSRYRYRNRNNN
ncbi:hypothetical protein CLAFUW4_10594 [Fulvia fulva]|uniref:Uncharacterized protein n=1 Tax=Passalora fulva TaxID=5499 RepID=A0A9Q8LGW4_PASFU|nr:uncharacterized protein CLAFUR5_05208 [Fulvia fulva]KAK4616022.1 hypothetical protein CLAFUR4_10599 [Fulvia fulva]KAK4616635.1 hypothetical protein CLAFUR0_10645 [Fulvia fulva]UJO16403.1 hypothetical protein CLAFUR5_05208 [Fulvia fulva]WPV19243.1 hypothetical protein CLAFUW4_10594 [Fulvia fulva]WPV34627.1 hypothetical protein CLAFUW7_10596 [Fulvia fulva]